MPNRKIEIEQLKDIAHMSGGYQAVADETGIGLPVIKAKMNGYSAASEQFVERVLLSAYRLGATQKIVALNRIMKGFERSEPSRIEIIRKKRKTAEMMRSYYQL